MMGKFLKRGKTVLLAAALLLIPAAATAGPAAFADSGTPAEIGFPQEFGSIEAMDFFPYGGGFVLAAKDGEASHVLFLEEDGRELTGISLDFSYDSAVLQGSDLYLSEPVFDYAAEQGHVFLHKLTLDGSAPRHKTILLQGAYFSGQNSFCVDNSGKIYTLSEPASKRLLVLDEEGNLLREIYTEHSAFRAVFLSPDGFLYSLYTKYWDRYGCIDTSGFVLREDLPIISGEAPTPPARFLSESYLISQDGTLFFKEADGSLRKILETGCDGSCSCLTSDGVLVGKTGAGSAVKFEEGQKLQYSFDGILLSLASSKDAQAAIIERDGAYYFLDLSSVPSEPLPDDPAVPPEPPWDGPEWDSTYPIDHSSQFIYIEPGLSFASLKNTFTIPDGYTLRAAKPNGAALTSGYTGTGAVIGLYLDTEVVDSLTVIALGDLDGSGTAASTDERLLYRYLNGSDSLSDYSVLAADFNRDGSVDTLDLFQIKKLINR